MWGHRLEQHAECTARRKPQFYKVQNNSVRYMFPSSRKTNEAASKTRRHAHIHRKAINTKHTSHNHGRLSTSSPALASLPPSTLHQPVAPKRLPYLRNIRSVIFKDTKVVISKMLAQENEGSSGT
ncbi:hypothetical protein GOBAR_DD29192 [Gossypium barbadense]|nr:hypothetical protein GOBAR_DD29192 [Gossypium barbadense]